VPPPLTISGFVSSPMLMADNKNSPALATTNRRGVEGKLWQLSGGAKARFTRQVIGPFTIELASL
jgi:hypothetical protein